MIITKRFNKNSTNLFEFVEFLKRSIVDNCSVLIELSDYWDKDCKQLVNRLIVGWKDIRIVSESFRTYLFDRDFPIFEGLLLQKINWTCDKNFFGFELDKCSMYIRPDIGSYKFNLDSQLPLKSKNMDSLSALIENGYIDITIFDNAEDFVSVANEYREFVKKYLSNISNETHIKNRDSYEL